MIITCTSCETRLKIDERQFPTGSFTVRCSKCRNVVKGKTSVAAAEQGEMMAGLKTDAARIGFNSGSSLGANSGGVQAPGSNDDLLKALAALLQRGTQGTVPSSSGYGWEGKQALACISAERSKTAVEALAACKYQVETATSAAQGVKLLRDGRTDLLLLADDFDRENRGMEVLHNELQRWRPAERRRIFLVLVTSSAPTLDTHAAFLQNVNLIVNPQDLGQLPQVLERSLRDFNELYRHFNQALGVAPL